MKSINNVRELDALVQQPKPVLLDFYADWCGPCKALLPTVEKLADKYEGDFEIRKVNVDESPELAARFQVRSIPALFFIQNGKVKEGLVGYQSEAVLEQKINDYLVTA